VVNIEKVSAQDLNALRIAVREAGLTPEEFRRWIALQDREAFAAAFFRDGRDAPWRLRDYQRASLVSRAKRKVHCDGRDVGKTTEIEIVAAWAMLTRPDSQMLIATQTENHLFPLMHRIVRRFETTPALAGSIASVRQSPSWQLCFKNGFALWGRIAGPRGINFQGLHVDWLLVDEAQEMTDASWGELHQTLNAGGTRWVYGVPNGIRNTFYRMTQMRDVVQFHWPSRLNPDFTQEKDEELAQLYGGRDTPGYVHRVLGEHGSPMHAVFNMDDFAACIDETIAFECIEVQDASNFRPPETIEPGRYYLGCDLGFARDPSEFVVFKSEPPHLINVLRVRLQGVNYALQQTAIVQLDDAYDFAGIGIDAGHAGRAVAHQLMAIDARWCDKTIAFEFGGALALQPLADGQSNRRRTKEFMTELLQRRMSEGTIRFPRDTARENQYASHTYALNPMGNIVYEKGNDHIIDADRCAVLRHYLDVEEFTPNVGPGVRVLGF